MQKTHTSIAKTAGKRGPDKQPRKRREPGKYAVTVTPEARAYICQSVRAGASLWALLSPIAAQPYPWPDNLGPRPQYDAVRDLTCGDDAFALDYARAREARADARADRIDDICQDVKRGTLAADQARVMIDAEKWQAAHEQPRRYGDVTRLADPDGKALGTGAAEAGAAALGALTAALDRIRARRVSETVRIEAIPEASEAKK